MQGESILLSRYTYSSPQVILRQNVSYANVTPREVRGKTYYVALFPRICPAKKDRVSQLGIISEAEAEDILRLIKQYVMSWDSVRWLPQGKLKRLEEIADLYPNIPPDLLPVKIKQEMEDILDGVMAQTSDIHALVSRRQ